jgi:CubicO group peptidase (beta-lactamase class C family)
MAIKMLMNITVFCLIILIGSNNTFAQSNREKKVEVDLKQLMDELRVVGLSVAVVKNNKIIYTNVLGINNIENPQPVTTDGIFKIASISKSFCATAIMQLVEAKKLGLDDDVSKWLPFPVRNPNFPDKVITIKMLLAHTSSINDSAGYKTYDMIDPSKANGITKCYSNYEPGSEFKYSNLNYNLIGSVIENASGERFDDYIKKYIIKPLGLNASFNVDSLDGSKFVSLYSYNKPKDTFTEIVSVYKPKREVWDNYKLGYSAYSFAPTAAMKISATDLAKYMMMHMNKGTYNGVKILTKESSELMQTPTAKYNFEGDYGLGLRIFATDKLFGGKKIIGHTGTWGSLYTCMFFDEKAKNGIVLLTSGSLPVWSEGNLGLRKVLVDGMTSIYNNLL